MVLLCQRNEGSYETIPDVSKDPPAIPKRVALDVQGRPEEEDQLRPKPKPLPRVSSLQVSYLRNVSVVKLIWKIFFDYLYNRTIFLPTFQWNCQISQKCPYDFHKI